MAELSVVVTCTDRKVAPAAPALQVRSLPAGSVRKRVRSWHSRVVGEAATLPLIDLYQGEHWVQVKALLSAGEQAGFSPSLWVASAGVGLQAASSEFPAYAATFSPRHADTVAESPVDRRIWWKLLDSCMGGTQLVDLAARGPLLVVLSEVYGQVLHADLVEAGASGGEVLLVGGSADINGVHRIPANGGLRSALGGTLTGLNARMAASWLERCRGGVLISSQVAKSWTRWADEVASVERYDRRPMTDAQVKAFIRQSAKANPHYSRTRLHRLLRDSGLACEQRRFAQLYDEAMGER